MALQQTERTDRGPGSSVLGVVRKGLKRREFYRLYLLGLLLVYCGLFYYFGEIVDLFGWDSLRWQFFYSVHDVHRLLFAAPVVYAAYVSGVRGALIVTILSAAIMMPRALFISPYPDPTLRLLLSIGVIGALGYLTAKNRSETRRLLRLERLLRSEQEKLAGILERMDDGVAIIGPDHRVRFMNPSMIRSFGEGIGACCYQSLYKRSTPCQSACPLDSVLEGKAQKWRYIFPDGRIYEVVASPYRDTDGVICQLATYREASGLVSGLVGSAAD